ncbi:hypothetical protein [Methanogenium organophilum]|uniref:ATP-grasp domain-containing protein n=1 Tax=Methanogenium organophilum TaxID=2199 RepID=A0A9X9T8I4_METOG|nr:hypothetical protein [Methanogenium organophilum]WAI01197.1 hypothetical protein OU421_12410 [Methanogenium organophilum]
MKKNNCALVLGGYVNGYSIIQELYEKNVENIILFDTSRKIASYSNKIKKFVLINKSPECLYEKLNSLHKEYEQIIIFPTDELQMQNLHKIHPDIASFCFLPYNYDNFLECFDKYSQYLYCEKLGLPHPKTIPVDDIDQLNSINTIQYPILIKPNRRDDQKINVFKNLKLESKNELEEKRELLEDYLGSGITFLASEIIPGDSTNIYAYVGYRSQDGEILSEWTGKKLSQFPDDYGVFSSASNEAPNQVLQQGRILFEGMDLKGIIESEFKYDSRDGKFKLMEINLRSTMWNRVGNLSNVTVQYAQYLDAIGQIIEKQTQIKDIEIHFVYLKHEILNLIRRKYYRKIFVYNIFKSKKTYFAIYDLHDIKPFLIDCKAIFMSVVEVCLRALKII